MITVAGRNAPDVRGALFLFGLKWTTRIDAHKLTNIRRYQRASCVGVL